MFNSYEFVFDGESSLSYGLMLYDIGGDGQEDVAFGNRGSIIETRTNNRIQPLHFGVNYHGEPLKFKLVFGTDRPLDRYELEDISLWLTGHQEYKWLSIEQPDLGEVAFKCIITDLKPISYGWLNYAFEATVVCDCPYAYGEPFEKWYEVNGSLDILFRNDSTTREFLKPNIFFLTEEGGELSIVNHSDSDREVLVKNIPAASKVTMDCTNGIIQELSHDANLYKDFNLNFFRLVHGDNHLTVKGRGVLTIAGRFLHNVAG